MYKSIAIALLIAVTFPAQDAHTDPLRDAVDHEGRTTAERGRDRYRHPYETVSFLGIEPDMTVVELYPGPDDDADHANGVWTLPPSLRVPEGEKESRYREIGESDRFTLKFMK